MLMMDHLFNMNEEQEKIRTEKENRALHLWFEMISTEANNMGLTMDMLVKKPHEIPITPELLKYFFRLYGNVMYGRNSTSKLTTKEFSEIVKVFEKVIAERLEISIPFPSIDNN